jgi:hypothetical protein
MGPEELGSVYESLLELVPQVTQGGRVFTFATGRLPITLSFEQLTRASP